MSGVKYYIARLSDDDQDNLAIFDCYNKSEFKSIHPRTLRRYKRRSEEMNGFLREEAIQEQKEGYNTTFLIKDESNDKIIGYLSLCTDGINLSYEERDNGAIGYETFPALKIARLAVHKDYQRMGIGKLLINYAISKAFYIREEACGVKFITLDCFQHRLSYYQKIGFVENIEHRHDDENKPISLRLDIDKYLDQQGEDLQL